MKKLLLGSTALVVGGLMAAPAMAADPIKMGVGGYYTFYGLAGGRNHAMPPFLVNYPLAPHDPQSASPSTARSPWSAISSIRLAGAGREKVGLRKRLVVAPCSRRWNSSRWDGQFGLVHHE